MDPNGRLTPDVSAANLGYSKSNCERDRMSLANIDDRQSLYDLYDLANRSNVSFYPVNPMGLEASGKPMEATRGGQPADERRKRRHRSARRHHRSRCGAL